MARPGHGRAQGEVVLALGSLLAGFYLRGVASSSGLPLGDGRVLCVALGGIEVGNLISSRTPAKGVCLRPTGERVVTRSTAQDVGYNVGIMAFGGTAPLAATALVAQTGSAIAPGVYLVVVAMVVFFVTFALPETYRLPLLREGEGSPTPDPARKQPP